MAFFAARLKPLSQVLSSTVQRNGIRTAAHRQSLCPAASIGLQRRIGPGIFSQISAHRCTLPVVICQRHFGIFGFFDILKQKLKEEVEKNEDFRNKVKTAQDTDTMKKAAVAAAATKATAESAAAIGGAAAEKVASKVGQAASAAGAGIADSAVGKISSAVGSATIRAVDSVFTAGEVAVESVKKTTVGKIIDQSINTDIAEGLFKPAEAPKNMAPADTTTTAVSLAPESAQGKNLTGKLKQGASDVGNFLDDRLFGRNETVLTLNEVKRIDPYFNSIKFVKDFEKKTLPDFFQDYMTGNIDGISEKCTELALRMAQESAKLHKTLGQVVDLNVLRFYPVQLDGARIEDGNAELYLQFEVQQVMVFVDKQGELKQGTYDDLLKVHYVCVLQRSLEDYQSQWKVHKLFPQGAVKLLA